MRFTGWDLALATWVGFVVGVSGEPPWSWETWAVVAVLIFIITLRVTDEPR